MSPPSHIHTTHGHIHTRTHMQTRRVRLHAGGHQVQSGSRVDWQARPDRSGEPGHNGSDCQRRCYLQLPRRGRLTAGTPRFPFGGGARYGTRLREWAGGRRERLAGSGIGTDSSLGRKMGRRRAARGRKVARIGLSSGIEEAVTRLPRERMK